MGFAVLHMEKGVKGDNTMTAHIERDSHPKNADETRSHLNKELIGFPDGVTDRTQAIQYRLKTAGIGRSIGKNQVQAIRIIFSASPDDMDRIRKEGKLQQWCNDTVDWAKEEFGEKNIVSAVLHDDEQTPHIHATLIPIVTGLSRKALKKLEENGHIERKYKTQNPNATRLCADDVMAKKKLIHYQDSYAKKMEKYGLQRGVKGSEARHISTQEYYRELHLKNESLKEDIDNLMEQKEQAGKELSRIKSEIKTGKLKSSAVDVATSAIKGIGSVLGTSKVKKQQQEIEGLKAENVGLQTEIKALKGQIQTNEAEHTKATDKLRQELEKIYSLFPKIKELLRIENLCRYMGFGESLTKNILEMKSVGFKGELYSGEYKRYFKTEHSVAEIKPSANKPDELRLTIDGVSDISWFRQKYREFQQSIGINVKQEPRNDRGVKLR